MTKKLTFSGVCFVVLGVLVASAFAQSRPQKPSCAGTNPGSSYSQCLSTACSSCSGDSYITCSTWCAWYHSQ